MFRHMIFSISNKLKQVSSGAFFLLVIAGFVYSSAVKANVIAYKDDFPSKKLDVQNLSEQEFIEVSEEFSLILSENPKLEASIRLPRDWKERQSGKLSKEMSSGILQGTIAEFYGPSKFEGTPYLTVDIFQLEKIVSSYHLLKHYLVTGGYSVESFVPLDWFNARAVYYTYTDGNSYKVYSQTVLHGMDVVLVSLHAPVSIAKEMESLQARVIDSFELQGNVQKAQTLRKYELFTIADFSFFNNWDLKAEDLANENRVVVNFERQKQSQVFTRTQRDIVHSFIDLKLLKKSAVDTLAREFEVIRKASENLGYELGDLIETDTKITPQPALKFLGLNGYKLEDTIGERVDNELWVSVLEGEEYYYLIILNTPSREAGYLRWAHDIATFRHLVKSIRPKI